MVQASEVDPAILPLPAALRGSTGGAATSNVDPAHPVEFLSVIFNQQESNEVLRISKKAMTPMWLTRSMYKKLPTDVKFEMSPIDTRELQSKYVAFEQELNRRAASDLSVTQLKQKAS